MHEDENIGPKTQAVVGLYLWYSFNCVCLRFRWKDKLSFPMLVKDKTTGERNVLCLYDMEAEDLPDVSPIRKSLFACIVGFVCTSVDIDLSGNCNLKIGLRIYSFIVIRECSYAPR